MKPAIQQWLQPQRHSAPTIEWSGLTITPRSRSRYKRWGQGALVWHSPHSILIAQDGREREIPIRDVTRDLQFAFLFLAAIFSAITALISLFSSSRSKGKRNVSRV